MNTVPPNLEQLHHAASEIYRRSRNASAKGFDSGLRYLRIPPEDLYRTPDLHPKTIVDANMEALQRCRNGFDAAKLNALLFSNTIIDEALVEEDQPALSLAGFFLGWSAFDLLMNSPYEDKDDRERTFGILRCMLEKCEKLEEEVENLKRDVFALETLVRGKPTLDLEWVTLDQATTQRMVPLLQAKERFLASRFPDSLVEDVSEPSNEARLQL